MHKRNGPARPNRHRGFTLIEVMIAAVIVVILASFVLPAYFEQVQRSRRADAMTSLLALQMAQEKWRANDTDYATLAELNWSGTESVDGYYAIDIPANTPATFTITASPIKSGPQHDDKCGTFAIGPDGPLYGGGYANEACWGR
jgi:type IV pilus assembly protein PilE